MKSKNENVMNAPGDKFNIGKGMKMRNYLQGALFCNIIVFLSLKYIHISEKASYYKIK